MIKIELTPVKITSNKKLYKYMVRYTPRIPQRTEDIF